MKLCFLCNEYPPHPHGGIGTFTQVMGRALVRAGHQVRVIGVYPSPSYRLDVEDDQGVQVWRLRHPVSKSRWVYARYRLYRQIADWSKAGVIDLVETPDWEGWIAGWPRLPIPVIIRLHGCISYFAAEAGQPVKRLMYWLERSSLRRADFWLPVSRYAGEKTRQTFGLDTSFDTILFNPVEMPPDGSNHTPQRIPYRVVFAGTLVPKKGVVSLVRAWSHIVQACPQAELHIYGKDGRTDDGQSMQTYLMQQLDPLSAGSLYFHGHVRQADVMQAFQQAHVAVLPSYAETFGMVAAEAMIHGCPVIFGNRTSGPEVVEHEQSGLLVDPDNIDEIAESTLRILTDKSLALSLGAAGQQRAREQFSLPVLLEKNLAFYDRCLSAISGRAVQDFSSESLQGT